nr:glycine/sarcosine/dimethylglycine n-methyltransferase [Quercus suber]
MDDMSSTHETLGTPEWTRLIALEPRKELDKKCSFRVEEPYPDRVQAGTINLGIFRPMFGVLQRCQASYRSITSDRDQFPPIIGKRRVGRPLQLSARLSEPADHSAFCYGVNRYQPIHWLVDAARRGANPRSRPGVTVVHFMILAWCRRVYVDWSSLSNMQPIRVSDMAHIWEMADPSQAHVRSESDHALASRLTDAAAVANSGTENPSVEEYYTSLESRLGYWFLLGNARHCGLWDSGDAWPFPISKAQRAMEEKLYTRLGLPQDARVLDAGAGSGIVASYMAEHGLRVEAIDLTPTHVEQAKANIKKRGLSDRVTVQRGNYHDLAVFQDVSFDGVYTMETFVHADEPKQVLQNFYRLLKPGGVLVLHEADFHSNSSTLQEVLRLSHCQNTLEEGAYKKMLEAVGFEDVTVEDLTDNVLPLWRVFGVLGGVPYDILKAFGLHTRFTNMMAGVEAYRHWGEGRYISVKAVKPRSL